MLTLSYQAIDSMTKSYVIHKPMKGAFHGEWVFKKLVKPFFVEKQSGWVLQDDFSFENLCDAIVEVK